MRCCSEGGQDVRGTKRLLVEEERGIFFLVSRTGCTEEGKRRFIYIKACYDKKKIKEKKLYIYIFFLYT